MSKPIYIWDPTFVNSLTEIVDNKSIDIEEETEKLRSFLRTLGMVDRESFCGLQEDVSRGNKWRFQTARTIEYMEARIGKLESRKKRPSKLKSKAVYVDETFVKVENLLKQLEEATSDHVSMLYVFLELPIQMAKLEEEAYATNRKYEGRLAGSLRDICRIHEPNKITKMQIQRFAACVRALLDGWGKLDRDKVQYIRSRLLDVDLTWLPVTEKAEMDVVEAESGKVVGE
ncbi:MAG: hypothetical protein JW828_13705 [Sedimentisphaerales bacterium]|nr:hypothetical protein [Sedimentisphaerales bacterium]